MNRKQKRLKKKGWKIGSATEFLELSMEEAAFVELKLNLSFHLKELRLNRKLTQIEFAQIIQSSQSRVAKMESGDPTVSVDLIIRSLFALGVTKKDLARVITA